MADTMSNNHEKEEQRPLIETVAQNQVDDMPVQPLGEEYQASNKRIAKNSVALYFRMFFTMIVGFYTSRVVLNALGVDDFGSCGSSRLR